MIRLDYLIFGYVTVSVSPEDVARISERFLRKGLSAKFRGSTIFLPYKDLQASLALLDGIEYSVSAVKGLRGFIIAHRKRYGFIAAFLISALLFVLLSNLVWDVRIEGCESGREDEIIAELKDSGLYVGAPWYKIDKSSVEAKTLSASNAVSWININRRGTVAYVKVVDKVIHDISDAPTGYANIVAERDCIIEEITVKKGVAMVKVGESVKAGDLLISGVIPTELGGGYCYAEGSVKGRFTDILSVDIAKNVTEKTYLDEDIGSFTVNFFSFPINILKICGNSAESCDIIEKKKDFELLGADLPFCVDYTLICKYTETERTLSADELTERASDALREKMLSELADADLISIVTSGEYTDLGYTMRANVVVCSDVSKTQEFEVDLE